MMKNEYESSGLENDHDEKSRNNSIFIIGIISILLLIGSMLLFIAIRIRKIFHDRNQSCIVRI